MGNVEQPNIPGDRYKTISLTSHAIVSTGLLTFYVAKRLAYIPEQDVIIVHDDSNHMHGTITSYNEDTGEMIVDIKHKTGSGTYSTWLINLGIAGGGATVPTSVTITYDTNDNPLNVSDLTESVDFTYNASGFPLTADDGTYTYTFVYDGQSYLTNVNVTP